MCNAMNQEEHGWSEGITNKATRRWRLEMERIRSLGIVLLDVWQADWLIT